jgi:hypothetical protein
MYYDTDYTIKQVKNVKCFKITYVGELRTTCIPCNGTEIITDAPTDNHGRKHSHQRIWVSGNK